MIALYLIMSAFLLFIGVYCMIAAIQLDQKSQNAMSRDSESIIFTLMPLWLAKVVIFLMGLFSTLVVVAMWLQHFGVIE